MRITSLRESSENWLEDRVSDKTFVEGSKEPMTMKTEQITRSIYLEEP